MKNNSNYEKLVECFLSEQIPIENWIWHLKNEVFCKWLQKNGYQHLILK